MQQVLCTQAGGVGTTSMYVVERLSANKFKISTIQFKDDMFHGLGVVDRVFSVLLHFFCPMSTKLALIVGL